MFKLDILKHHIPELPKAAVGQAEGAAMLLVNACGGSRDVYRCVGLPGREKGSLTQQGVHDYQRCCSTPCCMIACALENMRRYILLSSHVLVQLNN